MTKDPRVYLAQILERMDRIERYASPGRDAFFRDSLIQDAVIRNFEVIGEAAKRVPDEFRNAHPVIPWRSLSAFRDVLIHQYEGVSLNEVWSVIQNNLPALRKAIKNILPPLDQLERQISGSPE